MSGNKNVKNKRGHNSEVNWLK